MQMAVFTKVNENTEQWKEMGNCIIPMEKLHMKVSGRIMPLTVKEKYTTRNQWNLLTNLTTKTLTIYRIVGRDMKEILSMILKRDKVHTTL